MKRKLDSDRTDCVVMTVNRPKNYVHKLLSRLRSDLPVRLIVGSPSYDYLKRYSGNPFVEIIGVKQSEWDQFKDYSVRHRASWNYWRCFVYGVRSGKGRGLLILEDDVLPAQGWEEHMNAAIEQIRSEYGDEYILSLYTAFTRLSKPVPGGKGFTRYPADAFFGTQAMYYPEPIRLAFSEHLRNEGVDIFRNHYDLLLAEYLRHTGIPLFVTTPSLFQHIGDVGTGLAPFFHRAGEFRRSDLKKPKRR